MRTIIGWPAPTKQNTGKAHGSALGEDEVRATKEILGFDPDVHFAVDADVLAHARKVVDRGRAAHAEWQTRFDAWAAANPERAALLRPDADPLAARRLDRGAADLPGREGRQAELGVDPRRVGQGADRAAPDRCPSCGAARPTSPRATTPRWRASRASSRPSTRPRCGRGGPYGRTLHFGIREHAMGAIMNGITLHGGTRVYGGTFLVFSDYMRPPVRLAALMELPTIYVWTHDSIGLGEDGPTHQPIEHLAALRAIPGLDVVRPADANETAVVLADDARAHRPADWRSRCPGRTCRSSTRPRSSTRARAATSWKRRQPGCPRSS